MFPPTRIMPMRSNGQSAGRSRTVPLQRRFSPKDTCTRAEMATFLFRLAGSHNMNTKNVFRDVPQTAYYYNAVLWASGHGHYPA